MKAGSFEMSPGSEASRPGLRRALGTLIGLLAAAGALELLAGPGYRMGWWGLGPALQLMRWAATVAAVLLAVAAILNLVVLGRGRARSPRGLAVATLLLAIVVAGPPLYFFYLLQQYPRIHDISTDTEDPPRFVAVLPLRAGARNPVEYDPAVAALQKAGYPRLHPAVVDLPPAQALARAERVARAQGWEIVAVAPGEGRIEATATTLLFGFKDDIVIRLTPQGGGTRVDLRSLSRVGGSDFGANARRIGAFVRAMEQG